MPRRNSVSEANTEAPKEPFALAREQYRLYVEAMKKRPRTWRPKIVASSGSS